MSGSVSVATSGNMSDAVVVAKDHKDGQSNSKITLSECADDATVATNASDVRGSATTWDVEVDYLIVGAGLCGMCVADVFLQECPHKSSVMMIDKNHAPGGQWLTAYQYVRLHAQSTSYGVNSTPLEPVNADGKHDITHQASRDEILV